MIKSDKYPIFLSMSRTLAILTPEQITSFNEQGYLVVRNEEHDLVTPGELKEWTAEVAAWLPVRGKWMPYNEVNIEGKAQPLRTENFADYHQGYRKLLFGEALRGMLKQLAGEEMMLFKDKINYKLPKANGFHAHLDANGYDHITRVEHVTANFAIDASTVENGCVDVVAGSHRMSPDFIQGGRISKEWEDSQEWISVTMAPGDILFFGSHLAHRSAPNKTTDRRASLYATFAPHVDGKDLRKNYYEHRRAAFPPDHEREEGKDYSAGVKRYGFAAAFAVNNVKVESSREEQAVA